MKLARGMIDRELLDARAIDGRPAR